MSGADDDNKSVGGSAMKKRRKVGPKFRELMNMESSSSSNSEEDSMPAAGIDADYQVWLASNPAGLVKETGQAGRGGRGGRGRGRGRCGRGRARGKK